MKTAIFASILALVSASAFAQPIIVDAKNLPCSEVQSVLRSEGVVLIQGRWGFETHYSSRPLCDLGFKSSWTYVRSVDRRLCAAGYTCQPDFVGGLED